MEAEKTKPITHSVGVDAIVATRARAAVGCAMRALVHLVLAACSSAAPPRPASPPVATAKPTVRELAVDVTTYNERIHLYVRVTSPATTPKSLLVLIHGGPGVSHEYMLPLETLVDDGYAVATYDQRGVGRTNAPVDPHDQDALDLAYDLEAIRETLRVDKIDLVAHSFGGVIAMAYADAYSPHVRSLSFVDSMPPTSAGYETGQANFNKTMHAMQRDGLLPDQLPDSDCSKQLIALLPVYYFDPKHPATANLGGSSCNDAVAEATIAANANYDFSSGLARVTAPVLVMQGEADPFGREMADRIVEALTHTKAQLVMLPRCGHLPWEECPEPFFATVRAFLAARP
ncbi:MAG: alpha/beta fold hydrolase [Proteobacteria bacterium]|nr:alpha/beta fold hydrolase [Pseudomonadota bacterium]